MRIKKAVNKSAEKENSEGEEVHYLDLKSPVPHFIHCPNHRKYANLSENEWKLIETKNPEPLKDYHKCPECGLMWAILLPHEDE